MKPGGTQGVDTATGMIRLQRYLAECGVASRRQSETLISQGRVKVNGQAAQLGANVDPQQDQVTLDGRPVGRGGKVYILLNKPRGVITSARDTHQRKTVIDCLNGLDARVFPVGRLDMDVEGALLLTNDGELAFRLTHPSYEIEKVYLAKVQGKFQGEAARKLQKGVKLEDGWTSPAGVAIIQHLPGATLLQLTLHEGRKREVKRMCAHVGHPVIELRRISLGGLGVEGLKPGEWRHLQPQEVQALRERTGLSDSVRLE